MQGVLRAPNRAITQVTLFALVVPISCQPIRRMMQYPVTMRLSYNTAMRPVFGQQTVALFGLGGPAAASGKYPIIADEEVMKQKAHGTSEKPVMKNLKWGADYEVFPQSSLLCNGWL